MDPPSIASIVAQTTGICVASIKSLYDLQAKFKDAPTVVTAIISESSVISASLAQLQSLLFQRPGLARQQQWGASRTDTDLPAVLDQALTGCMLVFSCLEAEIQRITGAPGRSPEAAALRRWRPRLRLMWSESQLNDLLTSIRGQQTAMTLLIQVLQMNTLHDINDTLQRTGDALRRSADITQSLRERNPTCSLKVAESIYRRGGADADHPLPLPAGELLDAASVVAPSELEFDFDDVVINSLAYRKLVHAQVTKKTQTATATAAPPDGPTTTTTTSTTAQGTTSPTDLTDAGTLGQADTVEEPQQGVSPTTRQALQRALRRASAATQLDIAQDFEGAIRAYAVACAMLQQISSSCTTEENRRSLAVIVSLSPSRFPTLGATFPDAYIHARVPLRRCVLTWWWWWLAPLCSTQLIETESWSLTSN
ncbi:hypothetical protein N658DRAFT_491374 [Parathielavia hyrcaniae]|uniref:Fungal N-terminal domain-containing protein n=1 Tax=Parathielavia hyrcaniae TaxID=113614 RepID=A0AAN6T698_9PEZI|nr:hypothetical protein N658DRAFT_491374 [Parathielavia hyrcaniae]